MPLHCGCAQSSVGPNTLFVTASVETSADCHARFASPVPYSGMLMLPQLHLIRPTLSLSEYSFCFILHRCQLIIQLWSGMRDSQTHGTSCTAVSDCTPMSFIAFEIDNFLGSTGSDLHLANETPTLEKHSRIVETVLCQPDCQARMSSKRLENVG